jgi:hypothetical protein
MGALIHTAGTGYLCWFYNSEFEDNWAFHKANAAAYTGSSVWNVVSTLYDQTRQLYPLVPTPPSSYPNLVARWQYFFQHPVLTPANQAALLTAIHGALTNAAISGILLGVRHGSSQKIDNTSINGGVTVQLINIVVAAAMATGRDKSVGGPPPIDLPKGRS